MDLSKVEKFSHIAPLIVRLYDSHKLYGVVDNDKPLARAELTGAVTDLFQMDLNAKEQDLLADVIIGLTRQAERDLRQALAERLAVLDNVPLRLILHLANDEIVVAAPILKKSLALSDLDLIYIVKSQGADYWQAIAARENLSDEVIDVLAEARDVGTAVILSQNERITLGAYALDVLGSMAQENEAVARPLLMRPEMPKDLARKLYDHVGKDLKDYIGMFFGVFDGQVEVVSRDLILEFAEEARPFDEFMPTARMIEVARNKAELNMLNLDMVIESMQDGKIAPFIAMFSEYTGISARKVHGFLLQPCPKGMAIACRAFGIQKNDFSKIYLMTHRMRSKCRQVNSKSMLDVLLYFDKIRPEAAMRIVGRSTTN